MIDNQIQVAFGMKREGSDRNFPQIFFFRPYQKAIK